MNGVCIGMLTEVIDNYGPVNRFWFDHAGQGI